MKIEQWPLYILTTGGAIIRQEGMVDVEVYPQGAALVDRALAGQLNARALREGVTWRASNNAGGRAN